MILFGELYGAESLEILKLLRCFHFLFFRWVNVPHGHLNRCVT
jgi:hypothetical protein